MALIQEVLEIVSRRNRNEPEFLQAVTEVLESIRPVIDRSKKLRTPEFWSAWSNRSE